MLESNALSGALKNFAATPDDPGAAYKVESAYWSTLTDTLADIIREGGDFEAFLDSTAAEINFGLFPQTAPSHEKLLHEITAAPSANSFLKVLAVTDYLKEILHTVTGGDRKQLVRKEIKLAQLQTKKIEDEIAELRKVRRDAVVEAVAASGLPEEQGAKQAKALEEIDKLLIASAEVKKAISQGVFISVDDRRVHVKREMDIGNSQTRVDSFVAGLKDKEGGKRIREISRQILESIGKRADQLSAIAKLETAEKELDNQQNKLSALEIENRVRDEVTYLRDLVKLSATRLRMQSRPVIREGEPCFTLRQLHTCLERILEFDPQLLKNDRVAIFGHPSVLLVPGCGKGLYDWKHNQIIIPLLAYQNNHLASVATGAIEYRLDVDEDKKLLSSYNQLPEYKKTKSLFQLKGSMYKDYITWITSEYQGYRVLPSAVKKWFDREIAPNRTDIFTPPHLRTFVLSRAEFKVLYDQIAPHTATVATATADDLWIGGILHFQQGEFKQSIELFSELVKRTDAPHFSHYNLGIALAHEMHKQSAIDSLKTFTEINGQSWWSNLAREHVRHLQSH